MVQKIDSGLCGEYALAPVVYVHEGIVYPQRDFDMPLYKYVTTKHQLPRCDHKCLVTCTWCMSMLLRWLLRLSCWGRTFVCMSVPRTRSTENDSFENTGHFAFVANGVCVCVLKKIIEKKHGCGTFLWNLLHYPTLCIGVGFGDVALP